MGIHVRVRFLAHRVTEAAWEQIYADSLRLLRGWPAAPLGSGYREVSGVRVIAFTRAFEREEGWQIDGDAVSRLHAESFDLPKLLFGPGGRAKRCEVGADMDVLAALAEEDAGGPGGLSQLFGDKTQGYPYHCLIVAVATLIEHRLPTVAVACGDFGRETAERARVELERVFGEHFELPILLEPARIRLRVPGVDAEELSSSHTNPPTDEAVARLHEMLLSRAGGYRHIANSCARLPQAPNDSTFT